MGALGNKSRNYEIKSNSTTTINNVGQALRKEKFNPTIGHNIIFVTSKNSRESDIIERICRNNRVTYTI